MNAGVYRASIVCKKRGCPRIIETWDVDAKRALKLILCQRFSFQFTAHTLTVLCVVNM